ncbi:hypothetical protein FRC00_001632 [Tulasnella sp. 408]|nr:hypothetical protein FRC00_001632 [Tulasnella sp. 408]
MDAKLVAVKTIRLRAHHREPLRLVKRLARELRVWARLHHPHILPVLGYYLDDSYKTAVLISAYQIHGDLKDYLEQEDPPWDIRLQLVRDSTDGLAYLHSQDPPIRHGDLKPVDDLVTKLHLSAEVSSMKGNVLISVERKAMLADFGLSQTLEDGSTGLTTSSSLKGTVRYFSPELVNPEQDAPPNLSSDIWAWACVALEVLTGRRPYATKATDLIVISALLREELPSETEDLPIDVTDLKLLLNKCWSVPPNERPSAVYCLNVLNSACSVLDNPMAAGYNPTTFDTRPVSARYFVMKCSRETYLPNSLKYETWSATDAGNQQLDTAFRQNADRGPIYLFFSVVASGHFCGVAEMLSSVYSARIRTGSYDRWKNIFKVKWIFVRDVPNSALNHIRIRFTDSQTMKPVTYSRDAQELPPEAGQEMLRIFLSYQERTSLLDGIEL